MTGQFTPQVSRQFTKQNTLLTRQTTFGNLAANVPNPPQTIVEVEKEDPTTPLNLKPPQAKSTGLITAV